MFYSSSLQKSKFESIRRIRNIHYQRSQKGKQKESDLLAVTKTTW